MQKNQTLITDIKDVMKETLDSSEELAWRSLDVDLSFEAKERDGNAYITPAASNLPASKKFKEELSKRNVQKLLSALQFIGRSSLLPMLIRANKL